MGCLKAFQIIIGGFAIPGINKFAVANQVADSAHDGDAVELIDKLGSGLTNP